MFMTFEIFWRSQGTVLGQAGYGPGANLFFAYSKRTVERTKISQVGIGRD